MKNFRRKRRVGVSRCEPLEDRRLFAAGALDPSFSGDGKTTISLGGTVIMAATDVAVQADGKTVIVGEARSTPSSQTFKYAVARLNLDGSPDTTFGTNGNGIVTANVGDANWDTPSAVAIQGDGKIVVVGFSQVGTLVSKPTRFGVARFNTNGTLDKTFDGDGKRTVDFRGYAEDVIIQQVGTSNGIVEKIVVVGTNDDGTPVTDTRNFAIARLNPDGKLDTTFSGDGKNQFGLGSDDESARAVAIDSSGRIVMGGYSQDKFALVRVLGTNGAKDTSFGDAGQAITSFPGQDIALVEDLLIQSGDRIVAVGRVINGGSQNFALARYNADGKRDLTFGGTSNGLVVTDFGGNDAAFGVIRSADGGLIVAGSSSGKFALASYTADGVPQASFGNGGKLITNFPAGSGNVGVLGIAKGPGRRFVLAGGTPFNTARFLDTGANVVLAAALDTRTTEGTTDTASMLVTRSERLPTPTRIFFTIGGTAKFSSTFGSDYQISGLSIGKDGRPFVDIPANETFAIVRIAAIDDAAIEGPETAVFSIVPTANYELGTRAGATINIVDNDAGVTTNLSGVNDAYVRDGTNANNNFGSANDLQVKTGGAGFNRLSYIKFDLSSVSSINSAKLQLFGNVSDTQNASIAVELFPVADNTWTGAGITFNNKPAPGPTAISATIVNGTTQTLYQFDVTNYVKQERALGRNLVSFMLKAPVSTASFVTFVSGNAGSNQPKLSVIGTADPVGTFAITAPPASVQVGKDVNVAVKWVVPSGGWHRLAWVKLLLRDVDDETSFAEFKFDDSTRSFYQVNHPGAPASPATLAATKSSFAATGPTAPIVTTNFTFHFNAAAAGKRFAIEVSAKNDAEKLSASSRAGVIQAKA